MATTAPSTPENARRYTPTARSFTLPSTLATPPHLASMAADDIETLFTHPCARIVRFTTRAGGSSGTMPWSSPTERTIAVGDLHIYTGPNGFSFLHVGDLLHTFRPLPRCQCWCVDGVSIFAFRVMPDTYYRVELPGTTPADLASVEEMKATLAQVLSYERTACPFARGFPELSPEEEMRRRGRRKSHGPARRWKMDRVQSWRPEDCVGGESSGSVGSSEEEEPGAGARESDEEGEGTDTSEGVGRERRSDGETPLRPHGRAGLRSVTAPSPLSLLQNSMHTDGSGDSRESQTTPGRLDAARLRTFQSIPTAMPPSPPDSSAGLELVDPPSRVRRFEDEAGRSASAEAEKSDELQVDELEEEEEEEEEEEASSSLENPSAYVPTAHAYESTEHHAVNYTDDEVPMPMHNGGGEQKIEDPGLIWADGPGQAILRRGVEISRINHPQDELQRPLRDNELDPVKTRTETQTSEGFGQDETLGYDVPLPDLHLLQQIYEPELEAAASVKTRMQCGEPHGSVCEEHSSDEAKLLHSKPNVELEQVEKPLSETRAVHENSQTSASDVPLEHLFALPVQQPLQQIRDVDREDEHFSPADTDEEVDHSPALQVEEPYPVVLAGGEPYLQPMNKMLDPTTTPPMFESTIPQPSPESALVPSSTTSPHTSRPRTPTAVPGIEDDPFAAIQARIQARRSIGGTLYPTIISPNFSSPSSSITTTTIPSRHSASSQQQVLTSALVRRACAVVLGPPAHLVALMLRIAARIASGTWGGGDESFGVGGMRLEDVPGSFDLRKVGMRDLDGVRRCGEKEENDDDDDDDDDEDDFGVPLRSPVRLAAGDGLRERRGRGWDVD